MFHSPNNTIFANVIEIERHIEILLLSNDCVVVPGLGGFVAHHIDARYDEQDGIFLPPLRTLGFNPQLTMNDSLLAQSYVEAYDISYPEAIKRIEKESRQLQKELEETGEYELHNIGRLSVNAKGKIEFSPCEAGILTPELYGLSSFTMLPLHNQQPSVEQPKQPTKKARIITINTDQDTGQKMVSVSVNALRNVAVAAVLIAAFFMIASPLSQNPRVFSSEKIKSGILYDAFSNDKKDRNMEVEAEVKKAETATPATTQTTPTSGQPSWSIVLCSHVSKKNAELFVSQLAAEGVQGNIVTSDKGVVKVLYGNFASEEDAVQTLTSMRQTHKKFALGWVTEN